MPGDPQPPGVELYLQPDRTFWHALGEGTTQEAPRLDIRATEDERRQRLFEHPDLAQEYSMTGGKWTDAEAKAWWIGLIKQRLTGSALQ